MPKESCKLFSGGPLGKLGAADAITAQTTADDIDEPKPHPEVFVKAMEAGDIDPRRAIAVGDSVWDVKAARAAGIACVAVESGGYSQHELSEDGALQVYSDVEELHDQFYTSPLDLLTPRDSLHCDEFHAAMPMRAVVTNSSTTLSTAVRARRSPRVMFGGSASMSGPSTHALTLV